MHIMYICECVCVCECVGGARVGRRRSRRLNTLQVKQLQDGEAIHTALANSPDPQALQVCVCVRV